MLGAAELPEVVRHLEASEAVGDDRGALLVVRQRCGADRELVLLH